MNDQFFIRLRLLLFIVPAFLLYAGYGYAAHWESPQTSPEVMHLAGNDFQISGALSDAGDEVGVFDSGGILVGLFTVTLPGTYGDLAIYGDSALTPDIDEGASPGEELSIRVWDASASKEYRDNEVQLIIPDSSQYGYEPPGSLPLTYISGKFYLLNIHADEAVLVTYYCDDDNDTYIDLSIDGNCIGAGCEPAGCVTAAGDDCDDSDPAVNPGATEGPVGDATCNDGLDNDCDGFTDGGDASCSDRVTGTRDLPGYAAPGSDIDASIEINVDESDAPNGLIVNEYIPSGWTLSAPPPGSNYDPAAGEISWLFYGSDVMDGTINYTVHVPDTETIGAVREFSGELVYNDPDGNPVIVQISGDMEVTIGYPFNSYDKDQDWIIGDFELLDAIDDWAKGNLGDFELLDLIDYWAKGSYCWDTIAEKYKSETHDEYGACL